MEGEEIGLVLARASELRSRISDCIERNQNQNQNRIENFKEKEGEGKEEEYEDESLYGICDALESLEQQLASLQDLQHQQRYERESILSQIDRNRNTLLSKIRSYKGQNWELINEASLFAGSDSSDDPFPKDQNTPHPSKDQNTPAKSGPKGKEKVGSVWAFLGRAVRVGVVVGLGVGLGFRVLGGIRVWGSEGFGVAKCVVKTKKRVEVKFECGVKEPNVSYGSG